LEDEDPGYFTRRMIDTPAEEGKYMRSFSIDFKQLRMHLRGIQYLVSKVGGEFFRDPELKLMRASTPQELRNYIMHYLDIFKVAKRLIVNGLIILPDNEGDNEDPARSFQLLKDKYNQFISEIGSQGKRLYSDLDKTTLETIRAMVESGKNPFLDEKLNAKMRPSKKFGRYGLMDNLLPEYITAIRLLDIKNNQLLERLNKFYFEAHMNGQQQQL
jgi:hypothetical protein